MPEEVCLQMVQMMVSTIKKHGTTRNRLTIKGQRKWHENGFILFKYFIHD